MTEPALSRDAVTRAHAAIAHGRHPRALVASALRTRSVHAREVLAELAWPGHTPESLDAFALEQTGTPGLPPGSSPVRVADYARVLAVQLSGVRDQQVARVLLEAVAKEVEWGELRFEHVEVLAGLRLLTGDLEGAMALSHDGRVRPDVGSAIRADALHPRYAAEPDPDRWIGAFNDALHGPALAPILAPGPDPRLDDLRVEARPAVERPQRVTVLMSAYRRGSSLLTAARTVLAQTWTNLELLVVDDASGPGPEGAYESTLAAVEALDPRVQVIRKAVNGGTYRARNTALRLATGDFAIVIDSDDWWHPQTLELLAEPLLRSPGLMATRAQGVRLSQDLVISRLGYRPRKASAPTVLFRLPETLARMGFYDPTRKGADNEHARRLEAAFGTSVLDVRETTTLLRGGDETLSADEFGNGWRHQARHAYKQLYSRWHREISTGESSPFFDPDEQRPYPEPRRWSRATHPALEPVHRLDVCLAGDWRRFGGPQRSMMEEIRAARSAGLTVGVMHLEALRFMGTVDEDLTPALVDLIRRGEVQWVLPDDDVEIDVLMVRYPPILQYPPTLQRRPRVRQTLVMANQAPVEPDGSDPRYVPADVTERAEELFGAPVRWVPQSPRIRQVLQAHDPDLALTPWDNPGIIDVDEWQVRPPRPPGPVVGRHSRDDRIKFPPSWAEARAAYTFSDDTQVRMLGGGRTLEALRDEAHSKGEPPPFPEQWQVLPHGSVDVRDFLADLDFYVYQDHPQAHEAFGRTLLEAAASGVLTIAHPKHRSTFGDALDYAEPAETAALLARYRSDPQAYAERVASSVSAIRERFSAEAFVMRLRGELSHVEAPRAVPARAGSWVLVPGRQRARDLTVVDQVEGEGLAVEMIPLRAVADGERADSLTVVHQQLSLDQLRPWLSTGVRDGASSSVDPTDLVARAPAGVVGVVLRRDGLAHALGRGRWDPGGDVPDVLPLHGTPAGWHDVRWWDRSPPRRLQVRHGDLSSGSRDDEETP